MEIQQKILFRVVLVIRLYLDHNYMIEHYLQCKLVYRLIRLVIVHFTTQNSVQFTPNGIRGS